MSTEAKTVSIILGSLNRKPFLKLAIKSIRNEVAGLDHEIIVIDGGSTDGSLKWLSRQKDIITIIQHNRGNWMGQPVKKRSWGYFINLGFKCAQGKYVCMVSDDCIIIPGAIRNGIDHFDTQLHAGQKLGGLAFWWRNWPNQTAYSVQIHYGQLNINHGIFLREALKEVDYADEANFQFYSGDVDLSLKLEQAGYRIQTAPNSYIEHYWHANFGVRQNNLKQAQQDDVALRNKWQGTLPLRSFTEDNRFALIEKDYHDNTQACRQFWRLHITNPGYYKARILKKIKMWKRRRNRQIHIEATNT